ncbi:MAG: membrane protein insertase YidC [Chlamydiales bacterium]|nr:membrane protein insertase YidC [Chlamydiales bacterium]
MESNSRTIVFVLAMTAVLFGMNWFFDKKNKTNAPIQTEIVDDHFRERTANLYDLPIVRLYRDVEAKEFATLALRDQNYYITTKWTSSLPTELYALQERGNLQKVTLGDSNSSVALYGSGALPIVSLNNAQDVQVLEFIDSNQNGKVFLGEYNSGTVGFPDKQPKNEALVLTNYQGNYLPMGIYKEGKFTSFGDVQGVKDIVSVKTANSTDVSTGSETLYVLENAYQQIVFSNIGGAISEINLPFKSNQDEKSIVLPIGIDREIEKQAPADAKFPSKSAWVAGGGQIQPKLGGYYPLLRRGLQSPDGKPLVDVPARYYALNVVGEDKTIAKMQYRLKALGEDFIEFETSGGNRHITKRYSFSKDAPYCLDIEMKIDGDTRGLWLTTGVPDVEIISNRPAPALKYRATIGGKTSVEQVKLPKEAITYSTVFPDWICNSNGYFGVILDQIKDKPAGFQASIVPGTVDPSRLTVIDRQYDVYPAAKYPGYEMMIPAAANASYRIYAGPFEKSLLAQVDQIFTQGGYNPDYTAAWSFHGWFAFISEPFAKLLFVVMELFHAITRSWGFSIILLTLVLRLMLYPLNAWSIKSTMRMQQLQPKVQEIQARMKKDPKKAQIEMMQLYREHKVNPFTGGCLPILIQMPFLIGMFDLLKSAFALRGATFIPGWIDNLTAPDVVFSWSKPLPFIGNSFHILPLILGVVMFLNQKMMMKRKMKQGEELDEKGKQAKTMGQMMAIVFTVIFYNFPSGLNIYWLSSMVFGMVQQWWMMKKQQPLPTAEFSAPKKRISKRRK